MKRYQLFNTQGHIINVSVSEYLYVKGQKTNPGPFADRHSFVFVKDLKGDMQKVNPSKNP